LFLTVPATERALFDIVNWVYGRSLMDYLGGWSEPEQNPLPNSIAAASFRVV